MLQAAHSLTNVPLRACAQRRSLAIFPSPTLCSPGFEFADFTHLLSTFARQRLCAPQPAASVRPTARMPLSMASTRLGDDSLWHVREFNHDDRGLALTRAAIEKYLCCHQFGASRNQDSADTAPPMREQSLQNHALLRSRCSQVSVGLYRFTHLLSTFALIFGIPAREARSCACSETSLPI